LGAERILTLRAELDQVIEYIAERARNHAWPPSPKAGQELHDLVLHRCSCLLDDWLNIARMFSNTNTRLQYQQENPGEGQRLLRDFLDPDLPNILPIQQHFRANRSMRDVEPNVDLLVKNLNEWGERS